MGRHMGLAVAARSRCRHSRSAGRFSGRFAAGQASGGGRHPRSKANRLPTLETAEFPGDRMKIAIVCAEYPPLPHGGIGTVYASYAPALAAAGHDVTVIGIGPEASTRVHQGVRVE